MDPKRVLQFAVDEQVKFVDIRFTDLPGGWHHVTVPINQFQPDWDFKTVALIGLDKHRAFVRARLQRFGWIDSNSDQIVTGVNHRRLLKLQEWKR